MGARPPRDVPASVRVVDPPVPPERPDRRRPHRDPGNRSDHLDVLEPAGHRVVEALAFRAHLEAAQGAIPMTGTGEARSDAIVIGGGHNGLVCAAYLAK